MRTYAFRSDLFSVAANEDEQTNPFCYGKSLAQWTVAKLTELGYTPEPVIPEDWGWCVVVKRDPFLLWVGCGNESPDVDAEPSARTEGAVPDGSTLTWKCFVEVFRACRGTLLAPLLLEALDRSSRFARRCREARSRT
jgi:hypothetical protein